MAAPQSPADGGPGAFRRFVLPAIFVAGLFVAFFLYGEEGVRVWTLSGQTMGTTYTVKVVIPADTSDDRRAAVSKDIRNALDAVNGSMSTYDKNSELSRLNRADSDKTFVGSSDLLYVLGEAKTIFSGSEGAFDVTVGPLVNAWGFGPDGVQKTPTDEELKTLRARVGFDKVSLDPSTKTISKSSADVYVDLSAIAKGYGVDKVAGALDKAGYEHYMVEVGGEVRTRGRNAHNEVWRIGIERPDTDARTVFRAVPLNNASMATSGDYRNYREVDGRRISHTVDPKTARPIEHRLASVSVVHDDCTKADGWATALNVLGPVRGLEVAERHGLKAFFIVKAESGGFETLSTPAFSALLNTQQQKEK